MTKELTMEKTSLPVGWVSENFSNCIKLKSGDGLTAKKMVVGSIPVFGGNGIAGYHNDFNLSGKNIIIGRVGALCGNARYIDEKIWLTDNAFKISEFKFDFDLEFLNYLLNHIDIRSYARQAAQPVISNSSLKDVKLSFPKSIFEQKQIVFTLDKAFAAIATAKANAEQNLQNAAALFENYLQNVFENKGDDWASSELNEFVNFIDYRGRTPVKTSSGVRLITAKNIKLGYLQVKPEEFIAEDNYESWMTRGIPNFGDVIFTTEAPLGHIAQVDTKEKLAFAQRVIVMQPDPKKINQTFLKYLLLSNPIRNKILSQGTGATVLGIKSRLLKKIGIDFPKSIEKQKQIVEKLDKLSAETKKLETLYTQKIADLEELKKSVLQKAFSGQLKTNN